MNKNDDDLMGQMKNQCQKSSDDIHEKLSILLKPYAPIHMASIFSALSLNPYCQANLYRFNRAIHLCLYMCKGEKQANKSKGIRGKTLDLEGAGAECVEEDSPDGKICRSRWAAIIQKVYEVNPLVCPKCGKQMRIISFIEKRDQPDVVKKILKHCDLWRKPAPRAPPKFVLEHEYIPIDEFIAGF